MTLLPIVWPQYAHVTYFVPDGAAEWGVEGFGAHARVKILCSHLILPSHLLTLRTLRADERKKHLGELDFALALARSVPCPGCPLDVPAPAPQPGPHMQRAMLKLKRSLTPQE